MEGELSFTSGRCYHFAPPGTDPLPVPRELFDSGALGDLAENAPSLVKKDKMTKTKEERAALKEAKKQVCVWEVDPPFRLREKCD